MLENNPHLNIKAKQIIKHGLDLDAVQTSYEKVYNSVLIMNRFERLIVFKMLFDNENFVFHDLNCDTEMESFVKSLVECENTSLKLFPIEDCEHEDA